MVEVPKISDDSRGRSSIAYCGVLPALSTTSMPLQMRIDLPFTIGRCSEFANPIACVNACGFLE